jgi:hypothetical protein
MWVISSSWIPSTDTGGVAYEGEGLGFSKIGTPQPRINHQILHAVNPVNWEPAPISDN